MSFYTSLSGLFGAQSNLSTTSNNIANVGSNGFKRSRAEFGDIFATTPLQNQKSVIGSGTVLKSVKQQFTQGNIQSSLNSLDLAISGQGFFTLKPSANSKNPVYTRNGSFSVNNNRYVVDGSGQFLQVYSVNPDGTIKNKNQLESLRLPLTHGKPKATSLINLGVNLPSGTSIIPAATKFDRLKQNSYNYSTSVRIYDAAGNGKIATNYFRRTQSADKNNGNISKWQTYTYVGGKKVNPDTEQATNDEGKKLYIDKNGQVKTKDQILKEGGKISTGGHNMYYLYDQNNKKKSTPAQVLGEAFKNAASGKIKVTTDPSKFSQTQAGGTSNNLFWGKDFLWASFGGGQKKSISIKPGEYTRKELAEEISRAMRDAFGDDKKVKVRPTEDKVSVSFKRAGQGLPSIDLSVSLTTTEKQMSQDELAHLMQDKINRAIMKKDQELRNSGKAGILAADFKMDWDNPPIKVVYDKSTRGLKITRNESQFNRTGDNAIEKFSVGGESKNNLGLESTNTVQPQKNQVKGSTIIPNGDDVRGTAKAKYGMEVEYDEKNKKFVFKSGTTGDKSDLQIGRFGFKKTSTPNPAKLEGKSFTKLPANDTVIRVKYDGEEYSIRYKASSTAGKIGTFEIDGPYKDKLKAEIKEVTPATTPKSYTFKMESLSDKTAGEKIELAGSNSGDALKALALGTQSSTGSSDGVKNPSPKPASLSSNDKRGFQNRGFPKEKIQFEVTYNSETYRITYQGNSNGTKGTLVVEKKDGTKWVETNDIQAKFDKNGFFKIEANKFVAGQKITIPSGQQAEANKLLNSSAKLEGKNLHHTLQGSQLPARIKDDKTFYVMMNGKEYEVRYVANGPKVSVIDKATGNEAPDSIQVHYDTNGERLTLKGTHPITVPKTRSGYADQEAHAKSMMGITTPHVNLGQFQPTTNYSSAHKYSFTGNEVNEPANGTTMQVRSGSNLYTLTWDATGKRFNVAGVSGASTADINVTWTGTTPGKGKLTIETKEKFNVPKMDNGANDQSTKVNNILGHTGANKEYLGNVISGYKDASDLADGTKFEVAYPAPNKVEIIKGTTGGKPTFTTNPAQSGLTVTWDDVNRKIVIKVDQLSSKDSLKIDKNDPQTQKFLGFLSDKNAPDSTSEKLSTAAAPTPLPAAGGAYTKDTVYLHNGVYKKALGSGTLSTPITTDWNDATKFKTVPNPTGQTASKSDGTSTTSSGSGNKYDIDTTKPNGAANNALNIGSGKTTTTKKGKGLESKSAKLEGKSAGQNFKSSVNIKSTGGENTFQVNVDGISAKITIPPKDYTGVQLAAELQKRINLIADPTTGEPIGGVKVTYDDKNNRFIFTSGTKGEESAFSISGDKKFGLSGLEIARGKNVEYKELEQAKNDAGNKLYGTAKGDPTTTAPTTPPAADDWVPVYLKPGELVFDDKGKLLAPRKGVDYSGGGLKFKMDMSKQTTQRSSAFARNLMKQDGYTEGQLSGLKVDTQGVIRAQYSNGDNVALGKLAIANFASPNGLKQLGNANYAATSESGPVDMGEAGEGGIGTIRGGALERSNVDITEELVGVIEAQRNFQANAKAMETSSQLTNTIIQIRS